MLLTDLNDRQKEAVEYNDGPLLILAGAGSGKTRVLTTKIAYVIEENLASKYEILAFTFTNKAAGEMKDRVANLLGENVDPLWIGTFHSICVRILRRESTHLGRALNFTIYDRADQISLLKEILKEKSIPQDEVDNNSILSFISKHKSSRIPIDYLTEEDEIEGFYANMFNAYQRKLVQYNAFDFDDLIMQTIKLFQENEKVLEEYSNRFKYIYVDEYQDTNDAQYELIRLLASKHKNLTVVGDSDQSIYGWRGANISNINSFQKDYKEAKVIKLEQNYRSTQKILDCANAVITNNPNRLEKELWTDNHEGEQVQFMEYPSDANEAYGVVHDISSILMGGHYEEKDIAILYRTNAQSRTFEEQLIKQGVPYQIIGGLKFYDRKEVKDIIAYLRLIVNPQDDISFRRIINTPRRGIGDKTLEQLEIVSAKKDYSLLDYLLQTNLEELTGAAKIRFSEFKELYIELREFEGENLVEKVQFVLEHSGYLDSLKDSGKREDQTRIENLSAFVDSVAEYVIDNPENSLEEFLSEMALLSDLDKEDGENGVSLMTVHSAKGLEFDAVYLTGLEEGLFPHKNSESNEEFEEERRLCYVAITRAGRILKMSYARTRRQFGQVESKIPSQFLEEMEGHYQDRTRNKESQPETNFRQSYSESLSFMRSSLLKSVQQSQEIAEKNTNSFHLGDKVSHKVFGTGTIVEIREQEDGDQLTISFEKTGIKKINSSLAPLEKM